MLVTLLTVKSVEMVHVGMLIYYRNFCLYLLFDDMGKKCSPLDSEFHLSNFPSDKDIRKPTINILIYSNIGPV